MRKILSLLGAMILTTTTSASVIACGGENEKSMVSHKNNLNKFELPVLYLRAKINKKYNQLNGDIIHQNFGVSLKDGYEIKYYSDEQGTVEVTNDNQSPGIVYFTITAANDDPFWEGTTNIFYWKLI